MREELYTKEAVNRPYIPNLFEDRISSSLREELETPYSEEEVKAAAVFGMQKDKAPRPDGYSMHFYQVMRETIKHDLLKVFVNSMRGKR